MLKRNAVRDRRLYAIDHHFGTGGVITGRESNALLESTSFNTKLGEASLVGAVAVADFAEGTYARRNALVYRGSNRVAAGWNAHVLKLFHQSLYWDQRTPFDRPNDRVLVGDDRFRVGADLRFICVQIKVRAGCPLWDRDDCRLVEPQLGPRSV